MTAPANLACVLAVAAGLALAAWSRAELRGARAALGIGAARPVESAREETTFAPGKIAALTGSLGVLRAVAIDFLWLRAITLARRGDFFEAAALARSIVTLQRRIPTVWAFQARTLAYDIPPGMPVEERWPWVASGIDLLRQDGLDANPDSAALHFELAFLFYNKVGGDPDRASPLYRNELARAFEAERGSEPWREALRRARLDPGRLERLEASLGFAIDPRAAGTHALYWAEKGLDLPAGERDRFVVPSLRRLRAASLLQLFHGGRPVRPGPGGLYAFVPDLRFEAPARQALEEIARSPRLVGHRHAVDEAAALEASAIRYLFLAGDAPAARQRFAAAVSRGAIAGPPSFEDFLFAGMQPAALADPEVAMGTLAEALAGAAALEAAGEPGFAAGLRAFADLVRTRIEALRPGTLSGLERLPEPGALPFGVENLFPAAGAPRTDLPASVPRDEGR